jgi:hypothetical protein
LGYGPTHGGTRVKIARTISTVACVTVALGISGFAGTAHAVTPPPNDHLSGATVVSAIPFTQTLDTTAATTDAKDAQLNASCFAPATNNSVWYKYKARASDSLLVVDTTGTDYSAGVMIAEGTASSPTLDACNPTSAEIVPAAGTTYFIMVFDDTGAGGTLQVSIHGKGPVPANDKFAHATVVHSLPFTQTVDTTGATTDANDTQANENCGAPATGHSVWYKYTAGASDTAVAFGTTQSNFSPGFLVATGTKGALTMLNCGLGTVSTAVIPGEAYYVMVFDPFGGPGGTLAFQAEAAPVLNTTVQYKTHVEGTGEADLKGTYNCTNGGANPFWDISGQLVEIVGSSVATGSFDAGIGTATCDGTDHRWTALGTPDSVSFAPGKAAALTSTALCGDLVCTANTQNVVVNLVTGAAGSPAAQGNPTSSRTFVRPTTRAYGVAAHPQHVTWGH